MSARDAGPPHMLLVTGLSGAGKTTVMNALEDLGWETVENLPLSLLSPLIEAPGLTAGADRRPLALGIDSRTRDFDGDRLLRQLRQLTRLRGQPVELLFLDCASAELERRFSRTRRRHPLAPDRSVVDGIAEERELLAGLKAEADHLIDTTELQPNLLAQMIRDRFRDHTDATPVLSIESFGFARGVPRNADTIFDVRFLTNPFWSPELRPMTGQDEAVARHIAGDPDYDRYLESVRTLLDITVPRAVAEGKSYLTIAFGCTGGRHRSVHMAETIAEWLRGRGFAPTVRHRDLALPLLPGAIVEHEEQRQSP